MPYPLPDPFVIRWPSGVHALPDPNLVGNVDPSPKISGGRVELGVAMPK